MRDFDAAKVVEDVSLWIQQWFEANGDGCQAVVGISGGIDSSVVAALCTKALGKERVLGVLMPCGEQADIRDSKILVNHLDIPWIECNIENSVRGVMQSIESNISEVSRQTHINLPPRIRMATLYAVSQSVNGRVINTSNMSESYVGWDTRYGDSVGDCSPLGKITKSEIRLMAKELGLPSELITKKPLDGLCGKTDEESFGFTYEVLDKYIRTGEIEDLDIKEKIDRMHKNNLFKLELMPIFPYQEG